MTDPLPEQGVDIRGEFPELREPIGSRISPQTLAMGVVAGVVAGIVFVLVLAQQGFLAPIRDLAGAESSLNVSLVLIVGAVAIALLYSISAGLADQTWITSVTFGLWYGLTVWIIAGLMLIPQAVGIDLMVMENGTWLWSSLYATLVYGLVLGVVFFVTTGGEDAFTDSKTAADRRHGT